MFPSLWSSQTNQIILFSPTVFLTSHLLFHCFFLSTWSLDDWYHHAPLSHPSTAVHFILPPNICHKGDYCMIQCWISFSMCFVKPWILQKCTSDTAQAWGTRVVSCSVNPHRLQTWFPSYWLLQISMWTVICLFFYVTWDGDTLILLWI